MARKPEYDERLADWVDGRLSTRDQERLEAEFGVNPELRAAGQEYRKMVEAVRTELQRPGEDIDLSERIMAGLDAGKSSAGERRFLPLMASAAAAAAILLTFFALEFMPGTDQATPALSEPQQLASDRSVLDSEEQELAARESDDFFMGGERKAGEANEALPKTEGIVDELRKRVANAPPPAVSVAEPEPAADPPADLGVELLGRLENQRAGEEEEKGQAQEARSIEQVLRDSLESQSPESQAMAGKDLAGLGGVAQAEREMVLVVELPEVALSQLGLADSAEVKLRTDEPSRARREIPRPSPERFAGAKPDPARERWRGGADLFMQQPLLQYTSPGDQRRPQIQGGYLAPGAKNQEASKLNAETGQPYEPKAEDVYFNVAGDLEAVLDYVRDLTLLAEQGGGQITMQWIAPGSIQPLPVNSLAASEVRVSREGLDQSRANKQVAGKSKTTVGGKSDADDAKKLSVPALTPIAGPDEQRSLRQRRQNFVLRQRR